MRLDARVKKLEGVRKSESDPITAIVWHVIAPGFTNKEITQIQLPDTSIIHRMADETEDAFIKMAETKARQFDDGLVVRLIGE